ncbi:MAG: phosphate transporter, partial [Mailhella sp.]|nr:phosphate transporter [Mailhella sp.]
PDSILGGVRTLTAHMALVTANEVGGAAYQSLFMAGLFLLVINAVVSICLKRLGVRSGSSREGSQGRGGQS